MTTRTGPGLFLGALVIVLLALFLPGWIGAVLLATIIIALAALAARTWSVTAPGTRALRLAVLAAFAVLAIVKLTE
jgi:hypothetical protein